MKRIKENSLLKSIPESYTIQSVLDLLYPTFFPSKVEAKYFLTILGDNIFEDDLAEEIKESGLKTELIPLSIFFKEDYFDSKFVVYIPQ
jgi:hypothetical protein